eukprot:GHVU01048536.1.p1 GENE.GHVU01048536.1~~GHVU01048536.1.p1  ORF type:complete len:109 (-),score=8.49 GHVU01048536.1:50-376(-)
MRMGVEGQVGTTGFHLLRRSKGCLQGGRLVYHPPEDTMDAATLSEPLARGAWVPSTSVSSIDALCRVPNMHIFMCVWIHDKFMHMCTCDDNVQNAYGSMFQIGLLYNI